MVLSYEENRSLKALSPPPKCMHPLEDIRDLNTEWLCNKCGLKAKKWTVIMSYPENKPPKST